MNSFLLFSRKSIEEFPSLEPAQEDILAIMSRFAANNFFSLQEFDHCSLWDGDETVWTALFQLDSYLQSQGAFKIDIEIPSGATILQPELVSIGAGTVLEPGVMIQGPCIIGKDCLIRHGALLRGGVICGDGCVIGHASEVKHSILFPKAQVAHLNYVGDSILGARVNLGAGVKCANLRLDRCEISVLDEGVKVKTGLRKFGSILGDGCQIGCNAVLNPGTVLGPYCVSYPLVNLHGVIPANSRIKGRSHDLDIGSVSVEILEALRK